MALEIERRFLVSSDDWREFADHPKSLRQGYLVSNAEGWTIRVRILSKEKAWLTLKKPAQGIATYEFEYSIPLHDAELLLELTAHKIIKTRYPNVDYYIHLEFI